MPPDSEDAKHTRKFLARLGISSTVTHVGVPATIGLTAAGVTGTVTSAPLPSILVGIVVAVSAQISYGFVLLLRTWDDELQRRHQERLAHLRVLDDELERRHQERFFEKVDLVQLTKSVPSGKGLVLNQSFRITEPNNAEPEK